MPAALVESELFGREKGAYTGAVTRQTGRFEAADGGTIFLDEIGELPADIQDKLLRVLQSGQFERLGSHKTIEVDVRLIAATNRDLEQEVEAGKFREDLYYRLNVFPIRIPPLRERKQDIAELVWTFIDEFSRRMGKRIDSIPEKTMKTLTEYEWPGNVRELRNQVERAMIQTSGRTLRMAPPRSGSRTQIGATALEEVERQHILETLQKTAWRIRGSGGAAELLGMKPTTLEARMKKLGIKRPK
jgi:transcriptional regulator with GAF, ATPase, and Fis domain